MSFETGQKYLEQVHARHNQVMADLNNYHAPVDPMEGLSREFMRDLTCESFQAEMVDLTISYGADLERWGKDGQSPQPESETLEMLGKHLPRFVEFNPEVLGEINFSPQKRFAIDLAVEDIAAQVASLLPRKLRAYNYYGQEVYESIEVPGLGELKVEMWESRGLFYKISQIKGEGWEIYNSRQSGIKYHKRHDNSRPWRIVTGETTIELYGDNSGTFVTNSLARYSNTYQLNSDALTAKEKIPRRILPGKGFLKDRNTISWNESQDTAITWLGDNVLRHLVAAPKPEQLTDKPEPAPFPSEKFDSLFTFISAENAFRVISLKDHPERGRPDERYAIANGAYAKPLDDNLHRIGPRTRRHGGFWMSEETWATIKPSTSERVYVIDGQKLGKYGDDFEEANKTKVSVDDYDGSLQKPIVIFDRDIGIDEIDFIAPHP